MTNDADGLIAIRRAAPADRAMLFEWANDPVTREQSFSPRPIAWGEHCEWFADVLVRDGSLLYVATTSSGEPFGQARFDREVDDSAAISVTIAPVWRGRGLAGALIRQATARAVAESGFRVVHAYVKPSNERSRRAFAAAGYVESGLVTRAGGPAVHFRRDG